ncbi:MAG: sugar phosphate isomerase/epimerase [Clostridia bacterium]|nr:sugar phosphate isomerase/epimerase [Clostridia bacterium]
MKKIAFSSLSCKYIDDILSLAKKNSFKAIEWDMNFIPPTLSSKRLDYIKDFIRDENIYICAHLPYSYIEIAHDDFEFQKYSMFAIREYLKFVAEIGINHAIIHVGVCECSNSIFALKNLEVLAEFAFELGVKLCLENLIYGLTSNSDFLCEALKIEKLFFCLDTGHCDVVSKCDELYIPSVQTIMNKCVHSHVYKTEDRCFNHIPFNSITEIKNSNIMKMLLQSSCDWFTMELDSTKVQLNQKSMLEKII